MRVLLSLLALVLVTAPATAAAEPVDAGALRADERLRFTDARGAAVLDVRELRFRRAGVWQPLGSPRAVRDGAALALSWPEGATGRVEPAGEGAVRVTVRMPAGADRSEVAFGRAPGERFLGFGERSDAVVRTDGEVLNRVTEGPYQDVEDPFVRGFVPPPGQNDRADATYYPIPWALSSRGHGVLLEGWATSTFRLGSPWRAEVEAGELAFRVFAGPRPADALRRFTAAVGRQPPASAPFLFGPWWQPRGSDEATLGTLLRAGAAGSVAQTYTHYLPCGDQLGNEERERERVRRFHENGLAVTTYFNPMVCESYAARFAEAERRGVLHKDATGRTLKYRYTGSEQFLVGQVDFTAPGAFDFYGDLLDEAVKRDGHDGWMEDFGEYTPDDAVSHDGTPGPLMHNRYVELYHQAGGDYAARRAGKPLARFNRSGWTGTARHSTVVWNGDPTTDWGFDGLESAVRNGLSMGLSGVSLWGSDIGGFFALSRPQTTPELLRRWVQFGFASGVMRTQANGFQIGSVGGRRAQITDPEVLPTWARFSQLRTQLQPYLAAAQREYDRTGLPMMRQLALVWPEDERLAASELEYLLGDDLLVAPVVRPGATARDLRLPPGRWIDLWRSTALGERSAPSLRRPVVLEGDRDVTLPAPADELPLLVREGALVPLLPADVETLAPYRGRVRLADRAPATSCAAPGPGSCASSSSAAAATTCRSRCPPSRAGSSSAAGSCRAASGATRTACCGPRCASARARGSPPRAPAEGYTASRAVGVAQLVELLVVVQAVAGSSPVTHLS